MYLIIFRYIIRVFGLSWKVLSKDIEWHVLLMDRQDLVRLIRWWDNVVEHNKCLECIYWLVRTYLRCWGILSIDIYILTLHFTRYIAVSCSTYWTRDNNYLLERTVDRTWTSWGFARKEYRTSNSWWDWFRSGSVTEWRVRRGLISTLADRMRFFR